MAECVNNDDNLATAVHKTHSESRERLVLWTEVRVQLAQLMCTGRWQLASGGKKLFILMASGSLFQAHIRPAVPAEHADCPREMVSALTWASPGNGPEVLPEHTLLLVGPDLCPKPHPAGQQLPPFAHSLPLSWQLLQNVVLFGGNIMVSELKTESFPVSHGRMLEEKKKF